MDFSRKNLLLLKRTSQYAKSSTLYVGLPLTKYMIIIQLNIKFVKLFGIVYTIGNTYCFIA